MPRRKPLHAVHIEPIERRVLLSAATDPISAAIARVSDLSQYSAAELRDAREWAVSVRGVSNLSRLQNDLGAQTFRPTGLIDDIYFAAFPSKRTGHSIARGLETYNPGNVAWPLIIQEALPRLIPNDPQFPQQWHLQNTGQGGGLVGADANITSVWDNYLGNGVVLGIIDDGVTPLHQDLSPNYRSDLSWDFVGNDPDPSGGSHGTSVAGVAGARGNNGIGVSGAAPNAQHAGIKLLGATSDTNVANALTWKKNDIAIYNNSWGPSDSGNVLGGAGPLATAALADAAHNGRNGLGNIIVWAGGNGGNNDNVNFDSYANSRYTIAVGAVTNSGVRSSYSERGAPLLVGAYSSGGLGITTTSSSGYTSSFGGTSSASPLAAGVVALMLEANPTLTWRDVQHILVNSAEKIDPNNSDWVTNGAGHEVNHFYGYGGIDAAAAVALATSWNNVAPEVSATTGTINVNQPIPNLNTTGISHSVEVVDAIKLETVEVVFNATHTARGQVQIFLTSPNGTESVLATPRSDTGDHYNNWVFTTKRSWDEDARGTWTIRVVDATGADTGTFNNYRINFYGTNLVTTPAVYGSAYDDVNANGMRDAGEAGLTNVQIYIDANGNGQFDPNETTATTNSVGAYSLVDLELGQHTVRSIAPSGLRLSQPSSGAYNVNLTQQQNFATNNNFGFVNPRIAGTVFNDNNDNGTLDTGETGLSGITVFLDANDNGTLDAGETSVTTGSGGAYTLGGLDDGNYIVRAVTPSGQRLTLPGGNGSHDVTISDATPAFVGQNFGFTNRVRIGGVVYDDVNGNGVRDAGEGAIPNARLYQDLNGNGAFDNLNATLPSSDVPKPVPDPGTVFSNLDVSGMGNISKITVKLTIMTTWAADIDVWLVSPSGTRVELTTDNGGSADHYINTVFDDDAPISITQGSAPFTGTYRPEQPLSTFNGENANGNWKLEVADDLSGFPGTLEAWSLTINSTEPNLMSGAGGDYVFNALPPGAYTVRQVPLDGYTLTQPVSGEYNYNLTAAEVITNADFGNSNAAVPAVTSSGFVFDGATLPEPPHSLSYTFSQQVGNSIDAGDLQLVNTTTNAPVPTANISVAYDASTRTATFTFPGYTDGVLPDGQYTATLLAAGIANDTGGTPMGADHVSDFFVLAGDANHDGVVNLADFNILAENFGQSPRIFSQGDFNYDGVVNLADFNILASRFGQQVAPGTDAASGTDRTASGTLPAAPASAPALGGARGGASSNSSGEGVSPFGRTTIGSLRFGGDLDDTAGFEDERAPSLPLI